jgi:hypothetical protein
MGQNHNVVILLQGYGEYLLNVRSALISQAVQQSQAADTTDLHEILNFQVIVKQYLRAFIIAEPAISPPIMADQTGVVIQTNNTGGGQPMEPSRSLADFLDD